MQTIREETASLIPPLPSTLTLHATPPPSPSPPTLHPHQASCETLLKSILPAHLLKSLGGVIPQLDALSGGQALLTMAILTMAILTMTILTMRSRAGRRC